MVSLVLVGVTVLGVGRAIHRYLTPSSLGPNKQHTCGLCGHKATSKNEQALISSLLPVAHISDRILMSCQGS